MLYFNNITFYTNLGNSESDRYRVFNIIEALLKKGVKCRFLSLLSTGEQVNETINNTDIFVFFRSEMNNRVSGILNKLEQRNIPTIFDIDDLIFDTNDEKRKRHANLIRQTLEKCDFFTGTTRTLVENSPIKGAIIRNTINPNQLKLSEKLIKEKTFNDEIIKIGYFSGTSSHQNDFNECKDALLSVLDKYKNVELHIVGYFDSGEDYHNRIKRVPYLNYLKMLEYLPKMAINIAPLEKTHFNDAKSELKIFEAGLVLVPTIASATQSYKDCITHGINGYLASSAAEWAEQLCLLIENADLRKKIARQARLDFIEKFYIENNIKEIIDIYNSVVNTKQPKQAFKPEDCYTDFCNSLNLEYSQEELENLDLLSLFYKEEQGFNTLIVNEIKTDAFKEKILQFIQANKNKKICFWGAGRFFRNILTRFDLSELNITGIIDKNPNTRIHGYNIIPPDKIKALAPDWIILSVIKPHIIEEPVKDFLRENNLDIKLDNVIDLWFSRGC